jgi:hypothetical protein
VTPVIETPTHVAAPRPQHTASAHIIPFSPFPNNGADKENSAAKAAPRAAPNKRGRPAKHAKAQVQPGALVCLPAPPPTPLRLP